MPGPLLLNDAPPARLEQAVAWNHRELFRRNALALGGRTRTTDGLMGTYAGPDREAIIAFPALEAEESGRQLDELLAWYRDHIPRGIGCWSLDPTRPAGLGVQLLSRGFKPGWKPRWMAWDLQAAETEHKAAEHPVPRELEVHADNESPIHEVSGLPYNHKDGAVSRELLNAHPELAQRFIARLRGKIVGQSCVFLTTGELGVAGIYNVGVVPSARQQGIGKSTVLAACLYAKQSGYRYAVLNATGPRMYEQLGFRWIGYGYTWWLHSPDVLLHPPSPQEIALAEAIGRGDIAALDALNRQTAALDSFPLPGLASQDRPLPARNPNSPPEPVPQDLNTPLANGLTPMQLAIHCRQSPAAEWLADHGTHYTVADAWDLGWKDRAKELLLVDPAEVNRQYGDRQITLLHIAAERDDIDLARIALSAKPDLEIKDKIYDGTALGWARHLQRERIARLILEYAGE